MVQPFRDSLAGDISVKLVEILRWNYSCIHSSLKSYAILTLSLPNKVTQPLAKVEQLTIVHDASDGMYRSSEYRIKAAEAFSVSLCNDTPWRC